MGQWRWRSRNRGFVLALGLGAVLGQTACVVPFLRTGEVAGRVVDARSGAPVADAIVVLRYDAREDELLPDRKLLGHAETRSDADGRFRLPPFTKAGLAIWPMVRIEARVTGVMHEGYRCPRPQTASPGRAVEVELEGALDLEDRRRSCRPVAARLAEAPDYIEAWRALHRRRASREELESERQLDRLLAARSAFGYGENCDGPVEDLVLAPGGKRLAYLADIGDLPRVGVVALAGGPARHEARVTLEAFDEQRRLTWIGPGELVLWHPASDLDRVASPSIFAAGHAPKVVWRSGSAPPAAPLPSPDPGPVRDIEPRHPFDADLLNDEGESRWFGRSFALRRTLDPETGLSRDLLRITSEDGLEHEIPIPGEACGAHGEFGRPHYRIAADARTALDLRYLDGGCRVVAIDLETGDSRVLDEARGAGVCREARRVPASHLGVALRGYTQEVEDALAEAGADPAAAYSLRIAADGSTTAFSRDFGGEPRMAHVPRFPIATPLRRIDVSVVGSAGSGGSRGVRPGRLGD